MSLILDAIGVTEVESDIVTGIRVIVYRSLIVTVILISIVFVVVLVVANNDYLLRRFFAATLTLRKCKQNSNNDNYNSKNGCNYSKYALFSFVFPYMLTPFLRVKTSAAVARIITATQMIGVAILPPSVVSRAATETVAAPELNCSRVTS